MNIPGITPNNSVTIINKKLTQCIIVTAQCIRVKPFMKYPTPNLISYAMTAILPPNSITSL